jgi:hypothetical protein
MDAVAGVTAMLVSVAAAALKVAVTVQLLEGIVPLSVLPETVPPHVSEMLASVLPEFAVAEQDHAVPAAYDPAQLDPERVPEPVPAIAVLKV